MGEFFEAAKKLCKIAARVDRLDRTKCGLDLEMSRSQSIELVGVGVAAHLVVWERGQGKSSIFRGLNVALLNY